MKKEKIAQLREDFEQVARDYKGVEFWLARELQELLEYKEWRNFAKVIEKAKDACENAGFELDDHFVEVNKKVGEDSVAPKLIRDVMLTRYACYLIAQNGNPKKDRIAFAQSYFALQTRKQELLEERLKLDERRRARAKLIETETRLSRNLYERGVDQKGFGRIRSRGDQALFGGLSTRQIKERLNVPKGRALADFLPTITIKGKDFAAEITNHNVETHDLYGEDEISEEHIKNNREVRNLLVGQGIVPEELPPAEDLKKLERRVKKDHSNSMKGQKGLRNYGLEEDGTERGGD